MDRIEVIFYQPDMYIHENIFTSAIIFRYKNPKEDSSRLHYEAWELRVFENIECQWPMFYCFCVINSYFMGDFDQADSYATHLEVLIN